MWVGCRQTWINPFRSQIKPWVKGLQVHLAMIWSPVVMQEPVWPGLHVQPVRPSKSFITRPMKHCIARAQAPAAAGQISAGRGLAGLAARRAGQASAAGRRAGVRAGTASVTPTAAPQKSRALAQYRWLR